jgi:hypothetical protein
MAISVLLTVPIAAADRHNGFGDVMGEAQTLCPGDEFT